MQKLFHQPRTVSDIILDAATWAEKDIKKRLPHLTTEQLSLLSLRFFALQAVRLKLFFPEVLLLSSFTGFTSFFMNHVFLHNAFISRMFFKVDSQPVALFLALMLDLVVFAVVVLFLRAVRFYFMYKSYCRSIDSFFSLLKANSSVVSSKLLQHRFLYPFIEKTFLQFPKEVFETALVLTDDSSLTLLELLELTSTALKT